MKGKYWVVGAAACALAILSTNGLRAAEETDSGGTLRVEVPEIEGLVYRDRPVSVDLPESFPLWRPWRLVEVDGNGSEPIPVQFEAGSPPRAWFILSGETRAGDVREFRLRPGTPVAGDPVRLETAGGDLRLHRDGRTLLQYKFLPPDPPGDLPDLYLRSGYIHPVYSPGGLQVTEDFPEDHPHHKGVWTAWTRTRFEGRTVDFWNVHEAQGTVRFAGFETLFAGPVFAGFQSRHEHVDRTAPGGEKIALNETWDVRAWAVGGGNPAYWLWDVEARQTPASESPLELLEYHYGGFGFRGAQSWTAEEHRLLTSEGHDKSDAHATHGRWVAHSGEIEDGQQATVVILVHPDNFRVPTPMRVWAESDAFFCWAPVQDGPFTLSPGREHAMRYRFLIHDGPIDGERAEAAWRAYAEAPVATFKSPASGP